MEVAQLLHLARWACERSGHSNVRVEANGMRNQVTALIAAALEPNRFSEIAVENGISSLRVLLDKPVEFQDAAELFCLDLYKYFDIDRLEAIAGSPRFIHRQLP